MSPRKRKKKLSRQYPLVGEMESKIGRVWRGPREGSVGEGGRPSSTLVVERGLMEDWGWLWRFHGYRCR